MQLSAPANEQGKTIYTFERMSRLRNWRGDFPRERTKFRQ
jgi:hypothetical protein